MEQRDRWNPLRREGDAFRAVIGVLVFLAVVVLAAKVGGTWVGLGVFLALMAGALWRLVRSLRGPRRGA